MQEKLASLVERVGHAGLAALAELGRMSQFLGRAVVAFFQLPIRFGLLLQQAEFVGVGSMFIVVLTGGFTGAVFTLQSMSALERVGMESMVGSMVMLAVSRELAPVLTALMVTGRVASAMATELGTMRVTEQIDAMEVMAVDPMRYLVAPRLFAGAIMLPALSAVFLSVAFAGAYAVGVMFMGVDEGAFIARIEWFIDPYDFYHGFIKAIVFGVVIALIGCYKGYNASGGARGVGTATTQAVVLGSISIFVLDYVMTSILLIWAPA